MKQISFKEFCLDEHVNTDGLQREKKGPNFQFSVTEQQWRHHRKGWRTLPNMKDTELSTHETLNIFKLSFTAHGPDGGREVN